MDRRQILKMVGTGIGVTGFAQSSSAEPTYGQSGTQLNVDITELARDDVARYFRQASSTSTGEDLLSFIERQFGGVIQDVGGRKVRGEQVPEQVILRGSVAKSQTTGSNRSRSHGRSSIEFTRDSSLDGGNYVQLRILENGGVSGHTMVNDEVYLTDVPSKPSRETDRTTGITAQDSLSAGTEVLPADEWMKRANSFGQTQHSDTSVSAQDSSINCFAHGSFDTTGPLCTFIAGLASIGAGVLFFVPEPTSTATAAGAAVAMGSIIDGSCDVLEAFDQWAGDDCNISEVSVCATRSCNGCPLTVFMYNDELSKCR